MATIQDDYADTSKLSSQEGTEVADSELKLDNITDGTYLDLATNGYAASTSTDFDFAYNQAFSVSFYMKWDTLSRSWIITNVKNGNPNNGWAIYKETAGTIYFRLTSAYATNNIEVYTTEAITDTDSWHHILVTYDGSTNASGVNIYLNGCKCVLNTLYDNLTSAISYTGIDLNVNGRDGGQTALDGKFDEIAIWNDELTPTEVSKICQTGVIDTSDVNLISYWKCNDGSGSTLTDTQGANNLTITNAGWVTGGTTLRSDRGKAISTDLLSAVSSTGVNSFAYTLTNKPVGTEIRVGHSSNNSEFSNSNGDTLNLGAYQFDGVNDVITVTDPDWSSIGTGPFTACAWVKTDNKTNATNQYIIQKWQPTNPFPGLIFAYKASTREIDIRTGGGGANQVKIAYDISDNKWHHIVAACDGTTINIYVDGTLVHTGSHTRLTLDVSRDMTIGAGSGGVNPFDGDIADVRIYNVELSATDVFDLYSDFKENNAVSKLHWFKMNGNATDSGTLGVDGSVSGAVNTTNWWELPALGESLENRYFLRFWDTADEVNCGDITAINSIGTGNFSLSFWVRRRYRPADASRYYFLSKYATSGAKGILVGYKSSTFALATGWGGNANEFKETIVPEIMEGWTHIAYCRTSTTTMDVYVNGKLRQSHTGMVSDTLDTSGVQFQLGALNSSADDYFDLQEVRVYGDALTATEVDDIFKTNANTADNLIGYWKLDEGTGTTITDSSGNGNTGTATGPEWRNSCDGALVDNTQQTIDLTGLGFTSAYYYNTYMSNNR